MGAQEAEAVLRRRSRNVDRDRAGGRVSGGCCVGSRRKRGAGDARPWSLNFLL